MRDETRAGAVLSSFIPHSSPLMKYAAVPVEETFATPKLPERQPPTTERALRAPLSPPRVVLDVPELDSELRAKIPRLSRTRTWRLERHSWECLAYPFHDPQLLCWLNGGLALASAIGAAVFLVYSVSPPEEGLAVLLWAGVPATMACYICGLWNCVLFSAMKQEAGVVRSPGANVALIFQAVLRCVGSFLAGPVCLLIAGVWFWVRVGDMTGADWLILANLTFFAGSYWLFALVATVDRELTVANWMAAPADVLEVIHRLGWRSLVAAILIFFWTAIHTLWLIDALRGLHQSVALGWVSLWFCSVSAVFWMMCLLRWVGLRWSRKDES